ncbi:unnamed protein product [Rhizopus microsporus]
MNPAQANKIDISKLSEEERKLFRMYGKLPDCKISWERKYFDSGDYELTKAGKESITTIGSEHPSPDTIPHSNPSSQPGAKE